MSLNEIINEARLLTPQDRYKIIEDLVSSLDEPNLDITNEWIDESLDRVKAIESGELKTIKYEEVFNS